MSPLKNGWKVVNAVNRDVERQHLNRILAEIQAAITAGRGNAGGGDTSDIQAVVGEMVNNNVETGIAVDYDAAKRVLNFVVSNFVIRLAGDVSGQGEVNGLQSVTIPVTIDPTKIGIGEAPTDGQAYWRRDGEWQATGTALDQLQYFEGGGIAVLDFDGNWLARSIEGADGEIEVADGDGIEGNVILSLADVPDLGGGELQKTEFDSKGRKTGTSGATTDDLAEGEENLYFTDDRAVDAVGPVVRPDDLGSMAYQNQDDVDIDGGSGDFTTLTSVNPAVLNGIPVGRGAGNIVTNVAIGSLALNVAGGGTRCVAIGEGALRQGSGNSSVAIGRQALTLYAATGNAQNVAIGEATLGSLISGALNTAVGTGAGGFQQGGPRNTSVGAAAGVTSTSANANISGSDNTFIGTNSGPGSPTQISFSTAIGSQAVVTTNNTVVLGRASDTTVIGATGNDGSGAKLQVTGVIKRDGSKETPAYSGSYSISILMPDSSTSVSFTVPGAALGDSVDVSHTSTTSSLSLTARVIAANTVQVMFTNTDTLSAVTPGAGTLRIWIKKP